MFPFWGNFDQRPGDWSDSWPPPGRFPDLEDLGALHADGDARGSVGRRGALALGARRRRVGPPLRDPRRDPPFIATSLDLYASFHHPGTTSDWLLIDAHSPVAQGGLLCGPGGFGRGSAA